MTDDPLADTKAKLARADKHLKALDRKWRTLQKTEPNAVRHQYKPETKEWDAYFVIQKPISLDFSAIMGDALGNLRSCLDHLVACFVVRYGGTVEHNHSFPIYGEESDFIGQVERARRKRDRGGPLRGIPTDSPEWTLIKEAQPYKRGDDAREHPLAVLKEMVNIDKHRQLHPAATYFELGSIFDLLDWEGEVVYAVPHWEPRQPLEDGTHLVTLTFAADPARVVSVKNPVATAIAFGDHDPERPRGNFRDVYRYVKRLVKDAEVLLL
jgi:hypothetical protein